MSQDSSLDNLLKSLDSQIKYNQVSIASWGGQKSFKKAELPTVDYLLNNASKLTQEQNKRNQMVDDYLKKQQVPIEIDGVSYKYHNIPSPDLDPIDNYEVEDPDTGEKVEMTPEQYFKKREDEIKKVYSEQKQRLSDEILEQKNQILLSQGDARILKQRMDHLRRLLAESELPEDDLQRVAEELNYLGAHELEFKKRMKKRNQQINEEKSDTSLKGLLARRENERDRGDELRIQEDILEDLNNKLRELTTLEDQALEELKEDEARHHNLLKQNKEKLKSYQDELNKLNNGVFSSQQNPNEPDEAYLERLQRMAETPFDNDNTQQLAILEQKKDLRDNLKEIVRSDTLINQVVNKLSSENHLLVFELNKTFEEFKRKFLKKYGYDNKNLKEFDISKEIINHLSKVNEEQQLVVRQRGFAFPTGENNLGGFASIHPEQEEIIDGNNPMKKENTILARLLDNNETLMLLSGANKNRIYLRYKIDPQYLREKEEEETKSGAKSGAKKAGRPKGEYIKLPSGVYFLYSGTNEDGEYRQVPSFSGKPNIYNIISEFLEIPIENILRFFKLNPAGNIAQGIGKARLLERCSELGLKPSTKTGYIAAQQGNKYIIGEGVNKDHKDKKVKFGDIVILPNKLFYENILSIQRPDGIKINGFKNKHVSDDFVKVIFKIIENKSYHTDLLNLSSSEKVLLDNLLSLANLHKKVITGSGKDSINKLKKDLEILEGEIQAGNNNQTLKQKLHDILHKLAYFKVISLSQANKHYKEYIKNFF